MAPLIWLYAFASAICSGVDVYTAIAGAVGALYGPLHGGANEVLEVLVGKC